MHAQVHFLTIVFSIVRAAGDREMGHLLRIASDRLDEGCFGRDVETFPGRLFVAMLVLLMSALAGYGTIWASYGLRFSPTPQGQLLNSANLLANADVAARHPEDVEVLSTEEFRRRMEKENKF